MTKQDRIVALLAQGLTSREVALRVFGDATRSNMAYVRVARQRATPEGRRRTRLWQSNYYHTNPSRNAACKAASRVQYRLARDGENQA